MENKINVLMVGSDLSVKGGMTTVVNSFLKNNFKDINIEYVATHIENVPIYSKLLFFIKSFFTMIKVLSKNKISIVHIHMSEKGSFFRKFIVLLISKIYKKKVIVHLHGADFKEFFYDSNNIVKGMIKYLFKKSDRVIVLGKSWDEYIKSIDKSIKTIILANSVEYPKEIVINNRTEINVLFLSVLIKRKGIFDLVKAIEILINNGKINGIDLKIIIAGTGKEEEEMKSIIKNLDLEKYFLFMGWVDNEKKIELIKNSQILILPSYNEGLPMAILEAMSYGMPIITTDVGSIKDAVIDGHNGFMTQPGDINKLVLSMEKLILNYDTWQQFSNNSKKTIEENFNINNYFKKVEQIYKSLIIKNI